MSLPRLIFQHRPALSIRLARPTRSFHPTRTGRKNVLARYAVPASWPSVLEKLVKNHSDGKTEVDDDIRATDGEPDGTGAGAGRGGNTFGSSATNPVIASIQDIPSSESISPLNSTSTTKGGVLSERDLKREMTSEMTAVPAMSAKTTHDDDQVKGNGAKQAGTMDRTTPMEVAGVIVPPKPKPPGEEECCMSGCVNCVYTVYTDDTLEYNESVREAILALRSSHVPRSEWPEEIAEKAGDGTDGQDGGESREQVGKRVLEGLDPSLRAFLEMEARLKAKKNKV